MLSIFRGRETRSIALLAAKRFKVECGRPTGYNRRTSSILTNNSYRVNSSVHKSKTSTTNRSYHDDHNFEKKRNGFDDLKFELQKQHLLFIGKMTSKKNIKMQWPFGIGKVVFPFSYSDLAGKRGTSCCTAHCTQNYFVLSSAY